MARQVNVRIKGLAFCFIKNSMWNVTFVCDPVHPLQFTDPSGVTTELKKGIHDLTCSFDAGTGGLAPQTGAIEFPEGGLPNMSADYAHGADANGKSNLEFVRRNKYGTGSLKVSFPEAVLTLTPGAVTNDDCYVQEVKSGGGGNQKNLHQVATEVVLTFDISSDDDKALRVFVPDPQHGFIYDDSFPKPGMNGPLEFEFDNGCGNNCHRNDSIELYDIIKDKRPGPERQFVSGSLKNGNVPGSDPDLPESGSDFFEAFAMPSPTYGNCDPVGGEPPPGP